ncbi:ATP-dependent peptidase [Ephemerocybe angulata]|uniref:ATP-dependent peptidase n=1 Tax=Ephemerocybe angulata TaxID=980116 RepID=A0A8H6MGR2_9AGAR|nr:ATP-dependent peptidase [Tulosesus angulatus]
MLGLLARLPLARQQPVPVHSLILRHFSATPAASRILKLALPRFSSPRVIVVPCNRRQLSLGSIFGRSKPAPLPTPHVVAQITRLEAEANVQPHDVAKQVALFEALVATKMKSSYELVISRWERMCEFDPASPLLLSPEAFKLYFTCLINTDQRASVFSAVRRRDSLIAAHHPVAPATPSETPASATEGTETAPAEAPAAVSKPLTSQAIAESVLAGPLVAPATPPPVGAAPEAIGLAGTVERSSGDPIQVTIVERKGSWIPRLIRFLAIMAVSSFFFLVILSVFFENSGLMKAGPRQSQFQPTEDNVVRFTDVHGVDEAKEELQDIVAFLKDPASFSTLGGKLPKGVLLTGPPGTGKTMLARAVAGEAGVPFFFASGSDFEEMFVGVGAKRVRELFAAARKKAPAIIFIDELDAVGGKRSSRDQQYMKQTLNQLLVEMDGFQQSEAVIVIAATNFPESLDQALVRPGRFDRHVTVPLPDVRGRAQILMHHMRNVTTAPDVDPKILARGTPGFSGADLQNMVNQAAIQASKERATAVNLKHFEWAKDRILMGAERRSQYLDHKSKLATAYHEGGHALVALYTEGAMPLHKVTCMPRGQTLGHTALLPEGDRTSVSQKEYLAGIAVSMGGRVAEELIYGEENVSSGASSDIVNATRTAKSMVKKWGFSKLGPVYYGDQDEELSARRREEIEDEIARIVREGEERATALLRAKMDELHRLAQALVEHETLDSDEVKKVIKGETIRNIAEVLEEDLSNHQEKEKEPSS